MVKRMLFGFACAALAVMSAASHYDVKFFDSVTINGAKVPAGMYRIEVNGSTAVIKNGKNVAEVPVKVENSEKKYDSNALEMDGDRVAEIRIGGTHTRLVFEPAADATK